MRKRPKRTKNKMAAKKTERAAKNVEKSENEKFVRPITLTLELGSEKSTVIVRYLMLLCSHLVCKNDL